MPNLQSPHVHINQLIENKKAVNRSKDQVDIEALEKFGNFLLVNDAEGYSRQLPYFLISFS
jgi:hypothetical protein